MAPAMPTETEKPPIQSTGRDDLINAFRALRERRGWTLGQAAKRLRAEQAARGVERAAGRGTIHAVENQYKIPPIGEKLDAYAAAFFARVHISVREAGPVADRLAEIEGAGSALPADALQVIADIVRGAAADSPLWSACRAAWSAREDEATLADLAHLAAALPRLAPRARRALVNSILDVAGAADDEAGAGG
jgi:transcriptional regulator with XRE-family HTH domain